MSLIKIHRAFTHFYNTNKDDVYGYILARVNFNKNIAADITSDVFVKAYRNVDSDITNLRLWVFTIAKNTLIDYYRKSKSENWSSSDLDTLFDEDERFYHDLEIDLTIQEVKKHIESLSPKQKSIVKLYYLHNKTTEDISTIHEMDPAAVRQNLSRGIRALRNIYEK
jgi:RNA polymerase sigma-70 factor (ECF subfamily)